MRGLLAGAVAALVAVVLSGVLGGVASGATGQATVERASLVLLGFTAVAVALSAALGTWQAVAGGVDQPGRALLAGAGGPLVVALALFGPGAVGGRSGGTLLASLVAAGVGAAVAVKMLDRA